MINLDDPRLHPRPAAIVRRPQVDRRVALDTILPLINIPVVSGPGTLLSEGS